MIVAAGAAGLIEIDQSGMVDQRGAHGAVNRTVHDTSPEVKCDFLIPSFLCGLDIQHRAYTKSVKLLTLEP